jgi:hypothetical protein
MPRLSIVHENYNEPVDYCRNCYPRTVGAVAAHWNVSPHGVDMDNEHPDYADDAYTCESCGRSLTSRDN